MVRYVEKAMQDIMRCYTGGQPAQLLLTSKIENTVRDKLMLSLNDIFQRKHINYIVTREWKRFDLAVFNNNDFNNAARNGKPYPVLIMELKAMYSFDPMLSYKYLIKELKKDICKFKKTIEKDKNTELLLILLGHHILDNVSDNSGIIKYSDLIQRSFKVFNNEANILSECKNNLVRILKNEKIGVIIDYKRINGGTGFFDIRADLLYWIIKPDLNLDCND